MGSLTVRAKLILAFSGLSFLVVLMASLAIKTLSDADDRYEDYVTRVARRVNVTHMVREAVQQRAVSVRNLVLVTKEEDLRAEYAAVLAAHGEVGKQLAILKQLAQAPNTPPEAKQLLDGIDIVEQKYAPVALSIVELATKNQKEAAIEK